MKKNSFIQGAFIAILGIVLTKVIGILYVIPFYQIIGDKGGALYGYAYNIYNVFLNISTAGLPIAISKIISEYEALGLSEDKKEAFKLGKKMAIFLSIISFVLLFLLAPLFAYMIIGDINGGNTKEEITLVIRIISTAIIVVPILSIYRGYFQGHKYIKATSISQVIEQLFRVLTILLGSFLALKVFNLSLTTAVGIAVFGATVGALFSYFYILKKYYNNKKDFERTTFKERTISNKKIVKQILIFALPLVLIDIFKTLYNSVDIVTLVKTLVNNIGYTVSHAESIMSIISTWGSKLNMVVISISNGIIVSLVPNLSENYVTKNNEEVNSKINKTLQILLFLIVPMTVGLSLLAKPIWIVFYGFSDLGATTFSYSIFTALFTSLFLITITTIQLLKDYKYVICCLIIGLLAKTILNIPLVVLFDKISLPAHFGSITATIIGYFIPFIICIIHLKRKFNICFNDTIRNILHIIVATILMTLSIILSRLFLPVYLSTRFLNVILIMGYTLIGLIVYFGYMWKFNLIEKIFGERALKKIKIMKR